MALPANLGRWLLETKPTNDELDNLRDDWNIEELNESLIKIASDWDELTRDSSQQSANWLIWKVFSYPFFLPLESLTKDQVARLVMGCERITLSIPRLHQPDEPMENGFFMLWDLFSGGEGIAIDALGRLLDHPDFRVQYAALHGLGHRGDARIPIIQKYMKRHPELSDEQFLRDCLDGSVM